MTPRNTEAPGTNRGSVARSPKQPECTAPHRRSAPIAYGDQVDIPLAHGELFSPFGRRRLWSLIVRSCPHCDHMHNHKIGNPAAESWLKTGSCGAEYMVHVVPVARAVAG